MYSNSISTAFLIKYMYYIVYNKENIPLIFTNQ